MRRIVITYEPKNTINFTSGGFNIIAALKKLLYWLPRILSILFIAFISVFALDVFGEPQWFLGLLIHLIPSFILIFLTIIAWKHGQIGGFLFFVAGFVMIIFFRSIIIAIPAFIIGVLYLVNNFG